MAKLFLGNREVSPAIFSDTSGERYAIKREVVDGVYKIPDNCEYINLIDINTIGNNALHYAYYNQSINNHQLPDFSNIEKIGERGLDNAFYNNQTATGSLNFESLTDVGYYGMSSAFYQCYNLTGDVDLSKVKNVAGNSFDYAFEFCKNLNGKVDISSLEVLNNSYDFRYSFTGCTNITSVDLSSLTRTSTGSFRYAFSGCTSLESVDLRSLISVSGNYSIQQAFNNCTNLSSVNLNSFRYIGSNSNICNLTFNNCSKITSINLDNLNVVLTPGLTSTFQNCTGLTTLSFPHLISQGLVSTCFNNMLQGVTGCTVHFPSNLQSVMENFDSVLAGFGGTDTIILWDLPYYNTLDWSYAGEKESTKFFYNGWKSSGTTTVTFDNVDISNLEELSEPNTYFYTKFSNCTGSFSVDLSNLKTIDVKNSNPQMFYQMFYNCSGLTSIDLSNLKTIRGSSQTFYQMFSNCSGLTSVNLSNLESMSGYQVGYYMFYNNSNLVSVNLEKLSTFSNKDTDSNKLQPMQYMFYNCPNLTNIKLDSLENFILLYKSGSAEYINTPGENIFYNCGITSNPFINVSSAFRCYNIFNNCSSLTDATFPKLTYLVGNQNNYTGFIPFYNNTCHNITKCDFPSLMRTYYAYIFNDSFNGCTDPNFTDVRFPMLTIMNNNPFTQYSFRVNGSRRLTVHFRKDMQSTIEALSGYNDLWYASAIVFDQIGTITINGNTYYRIGFCNKPGYIAWIKSDSNIIINGTTYTYDQSSISYFNKYSELTPNILHGVAFYWKDSSNNSVRSHKIELEDGDLVYSSIDVPDPDLEITTANIEIIYTVDSAEPDVGDSAYSDLGTTVIGTISIVA